MMRRPLTPGPSPASGRGEQTLGCVGFFGLCNVRSCAPSPACGRGLG
ncbi:hypothetical protein CBM2587_A120122 [Cupriavidus taiwanensis]|uniref:Uncharacterized protein n=1 Tax=Cupriavidus taiwanensis TaxID=164546 RepID=A0A975WUT0_9BURK|nr:hypothetical protein CBM2587_A120122 [Cupriavidus taiwanensis]